MTYPDDDDTPPSPSHSGGLYYTSKTAWDVKKDVTRTFGDEADIQISDSDIFRWINTAQREILINNRVIKSIGRTYVEEGVSEYDLSSLEIISIQSIRFKNRKLVYRSFNEAEEHILKHEHSEAHQGHPTLWFEWAGIVNIWPVPTEDVEDGLVVYYVKEPKKVTSTNDRLSLPDSYYENILQFVMSKAYELDEDMPNHNMKLAEFKERIGVLAEQDADNSQDFYPRITIREEDAW